MNGPDQDMPESTARPQRRTRRNTAEPAVAVLDRAVQATPAAPVIAPSPAVPLDLVQVTIGSALWTPGVPDPQEGQYAPAAWAIRIEGPKSTGEGRTALQWRGVLPRSTLERARHHAIIEALRRITPGRRVLLLTGAPTERSETDGLRDVIALLRTRLDVQFTPGPGYNHEAWRLLEQAAAQGQITPPLPGTPDTYWLGEAQPGVMVDPHEPGFLLSAQGPRALRHDAWVPYRPPAGQHPGPQVSLGLDWQYHSRTEGEARLVQITRTGEAMPICSVRLPYPFLQKQFSFTKGGLTLDGSLLREVQRPYPVLPARVTRKPAVPSPEAARQVQRLF